MAKCKELMMIEAGGELTWFMTARELARMREREPKRTLGDVLKWVVCISEKGRAIMTGFGLAIPDGVIRLGEMARNGRVEWIMHGFVPGREIEIIRQWAGSVSSEDGVHCVVSVKRARRQLWRLARGAMGALAPLVNLLLEAWVGVRAQAVWNEVIDARVYNRQIRAVLPGFPSLSFPSRECIGIEGLEWLRESEGQVIETMCTLERDGVMQWVNGFMAYRLSTGLDMDVVYEETGEVEEGDKKKRRRAAEVTLRELCVKYYDRILGGVVAALQAVPNGSFMMPDMLQKLVEIAEDRRRISHHEGGKNPEDIIAYVSFRWGFLRALHEDNLRRLETGKGGDDVRFHHLLRTFRSLEVTLTPEGFRPAYPGYVPTPDERLRWTTRFRTYRDALGRLVRLGGGGGMELVKQTPVNFFPGYRPPDLTRYMAWVLAEKKLFDRLGGTFAGFSNSRAFRARMEKMGIEWLVCPYGGNTDGSPKSVVFPPRTKK